jgi:SAM-dependent methyltransferase
MIEELEEAAASDGLEIDARVGDGMALPFEDASFDAAFTMFGLMFYPDRDKGIRELARVLREGGHVGISTWAPMNRSPAFAAPFDVLRSLVPGMPPNDGKAPLGTPEKMREALAAAGFRRIDVQEVVSELEVPSPDDLWATMERTTAPIALMKSKMGPAWKELSAKVADCLRMRVGEGPIKIDLIGVVGIAAR